MRSNNTENDDRRRKKNKEETIVNETFQTLVDDTEDIFSIPIEETANAPTHLVLPVKNVLSSSVASSLNSRIYQYSSYSVQKSYQTPLHQQQRQSHQEFTSSLSFSDVQHHSHHPSSFNRRSCEKNTIDHFPSLIRPSSSTPTLPPPPSSSSLSNSYSSSLSSSSNHCVLSQINVNGLVENKEANNEADNDHLLQSNDNNHYSEDIFGSKYSPLLLTSSASSESPSSRAPFYHTRHEHSCHLHENQSHQITEHINTYSKYSNASNSTSLASTSGNDITLITSNNERTVNVNNGEQIFSEVNIMKTPKTQIVPDDNMDNSQNDMPESDVVSMKDAVSSSTVKDYYEDMRKEMKNDMTATVISNLELARKQQSFKLRYQKSLIRDQSRKQSDGQENTNALLDFSSRKIPNLYHFKYNRNAPKKVIKIPRKADESDWVSPDDFMKLSYNFYVTLSSNFMAKDDRVLKSVPYHLFGNETYESCDLVQNHFDDHHLQLFNATPLKGYGSKRSQVKIPSEKLKLIKQVVTKFGKNAKVFEYLAQIDELRRIMNYQLQASSTYNPNGLQQIDYGKLLEKEYKKFTDGEVEEYVQPIRHANVIDLEEANHTFKFLYCPKCAEFECQKHSNESHSYDSIKIFNHHSMKDRIKNTTKQLKKYDHNKKLRKKGQPCSEKCIWKTRKPIKSNIDISKWTYEERFLLLGYIPIFKTNSCLLSMAIKTKTCKQIFRYLHHLTQQLSAGVKLSLLFDFEKYFTDSSGSKNSKQSSCTISKMSGNADYDEEEEEDDEDNDKGEDDEDDEDDVDVVIRSLEGKGRHIPCLCRDGCKDDCPCVLSNNMCSKWCACSNKCKHKFQGCNCKGDCRTLKCPCAKAGRECDKDLCTGHSEGYCACENMGMQHGYQAKLGIGKSNTHGWGLFALQPIKKDDYISEYSGEIISQQEAERRGKFYDLMNLSYMFNLTQEYVIDAYRKGGLTRFINHSSNPNCFCRVLYVLGDYRVGIFAGKDIKKGEELFFDYAYGKVGDKPDWMKSRSRKQSL